MTTTSRGLGEGPGPTPASRKRRERIMSQKIHEESSLCRWGGDGPRLVNVPRNDSGHGHDTRREERDRKSTRLNSSHGYISYAVFCLKKKKKKKKIQPQHEHNITKESA